MRRPRGLLPTCLVLVATVGLTPLADAAEDRGAARAGTGSFTAEVGWATRAHLADEQVDAAAGSVQGRVFAVPGGVPTGATDRAATARALAGAPAAPTGPDPMRSTVVDRDPADVASWERWRYATSQAARTGALPAPPGFVGGEPTANNDRVSTAQAVDRRGDDVVEIAGRIDPMPATQRTIAAAPCDQGFDDGSVAGFCTFGFVEDEPNWSSFTVRGVLGDGQYGGSSGDVDVYGIGPQRGGRDVTVEMRRTGGDLDPYVEVWAGDRSTGQLALVTVADDVNGQDLDTFTTFTMPAALDGWELFVFAEAFGSQPSDPTDPASAGGATSTGPYELSVWRRGVDVDTFTVDLPAGRLVAADLFGVPSGLGMLTTAGEPLRVAWLQQAALPLASGIREPLADPDATTLLTQFTDGAGRYAFQVAGAPGNYTLRLRLEDRTGAERVPGRTQAVFLDFDGHALTPSDVFGDQANGQRVTLRPLADFLPEFGLGAADEDAVIDGVVARFEDAFGQVLADQPGRRELRILNSRDHQMPARDATRLVVGGTTEQLGIPTVGLAESVDVGNLDLEEFAVVLLDDLLGWQGDPGLLDEVTVDDADRAELVGVGVGSIAVHELGHVLGNWHTELRPGSDHPVPHADNQRLGVVSGLMDRGGDLQTMLGAGDDLVFGNGDDRRAQFVRDVYEFNEGWLGTQDSAITTAEALAWLQPTDATVLGGSRVVAGGVVDVLEDTFAGRLSRLDGANRYETAAAIVAAAFPRRAPVVYLATGSAFPDALAGAAAAAADDAPVLLTGSTTLPDPTRRQLERLRPDRVVITGGTAAVGAEVAREVAELTGARVVRREGTDRYDTAAAIVAAAFPDTEDVVYVATGVDFPDALAGAAAAAREGAPVLLAGRTTLATDAQDQLRRLRPRVVRLLGGTNAVGENVAERIAELTGATVQRIAGTDRFATAGALVDRVFPERVDAVFVATGRDFPDALAGVSAAARRGAPVVLVEQDAVPARVARSLDRLGDY